MKYLGFPRLRMTSQETMPIANFEYAADPTATVNPPLTPVTWLNTTTGNVFICIDNTTDANVWEHIGGGPAINYAIPVSITGATSLTSAAVGKHHVCSGTTADYTVDLPSSGVNAGDLISFEMASTLTYLVTIDAGSGVDIDGSQTRIMWAKETAVLKYDGSNWQKVGGKSLPLMSSAYPTSDQTFAASATFSTYTTLILGATGDPAPSVASMCDLANNKLVAPRVSTWQMLILLNSRGNNTSAHTIFCYPITGTGKSAQLWTYVPASKSVSCMGSFFVAQASGDFYVRLCYDLGNYASSVFHNNNKDRTRIQLIEHPDW